jgi:hypothetical protein
MRMVWRFRANVEPQIAASADLDHGLVPRPSFVVTRFADSSGLATYLAERSSGLNNSSPKRGGTV